MKHNHRYARGVLFTPKAVFRVDNPVSSRYEARSLADEVASSKLPKIVTASYYERGHYRKCPSYKKKHCTFNPVENHGYPGSYMNFHHRHLYSTEATSFTIIAHFLSSYLNFHHRHLYPLHPTFSDLPLASSPFPL